jgi:hypothetical protein
MACVQSITPMLNDEPTITSWSVNVESPDKVLTIEGSAGRARVEELLGRAGYHVLGEIPVESAPAPAPEPKSARSTYFPLLLILAYLLGVVAIIEMNAGSFDSMRAMSYFMGGFFLVFSFFKLLNLNGFAQTYAGYDVLAGNWYAWGYLYPFAELALGIAYCLRIAPVAVNAATLALMTLGTIGVVRSLLARRTIKCACLGSFFDLPMSTVTLLEDLLMAGMALGMLVAGSVPG